MVLCWSSVTSPINKRMELQFLLSSVCPYTEDSRIGTHGRMFRNWRGCQESKEHTPSNVYPWPRTMSLCWQPVQRYHWQYHGTDLHAQRTGKRCSPSREHAYSSYTRQIIFPRVPALRRVLRQVPLTTEILTSQLTHFYEHFQRKKLRNDNIIPPTIFHVWY